MGATPQYWVLVLVFALIVYIIVIESGLLIGAWMAFLFTVILLPAAFLEVY